MSLVIRMARAGTKKRPVYHIVVADSRSPRDGRFIERLGYFNPLLPKDKAERLKLDLEKVQAWMKKGAQPSDRVTRFLDAAGIVSARSATIRKRRSRARSARPRRKKPPRPRKPRRRCQAARPQGHRQPPARPPTAQRDARGERAASASAASAPRMAFAAK